MPPEILPKKICGLFAMMVTPLNINITVRCSLHCRCNLTQLVTSVKQCRNPFTEPPTDSTTYRKKHFKFPFNLTGKSTMAFLTGQSWCILKSWYTGVGGGGRGREQGFWHYFANGLNQSLVSSVYDNITVDNTSPKLGSLDLWPAFFTLNSILTKKANNVFLDWYILRY